LGPSEFIDELEKTWNIRKFNQLSAQQGLSFIVIHGNNRQHQNEKQANDNLNTYQMTEYVI
jgi:hypothetical protein